MKKTNPQQSEKFNAEVQRMVDAGELDPIEAAAAMEAAMGRVKADAQKPSEDTGETRLH